MLSRRQAQRAQPENPIAVPMSRTDIGDYLGLTTETVSRTITSLKTSNVIRAISGGRIEMTDPDHLRDMAEGM